MNERNERPGADDRIVDDFFAAHRERVRDHTADDRTWEVITSRAEVPGRSRIGWFLGGAAAASVAALVLFLSQGLGQDQGAVNPAGSSADPVAVTTASPTPGPEDPTGSDGDSASADVEPDDQAAPVEGSGTAEPTGAQEPTEEETAEPEVETFELSALSPDVALREVFEPTGDETDLRAAVVGYDCGSPESFCPGLVVSEDAGRTWSPSVDMSAEGFYGAVNAREHIWLWSPAEGDPSAPEPRSALVRSDDAGRTWTEVATRGEGVLWVEGFRATLVVVTEGCEGGSREDCLEMVITDLDTADASDGRRVITVRDLPAGWRGGPGILPAYGALQATYDAVYLVLPDGGTYRIADDSTEATFVPGSDTSADETAGCILATAPDSQDTLLVRCPGTTDVRVSPDGGSTWETVTGPAGQQATGVASNDGQRLFVSTDEGLFARDADGTDWEQLLEEAFPWALLKAYANDEVRYGDFLRHQVTDDGTPTRRWHSDDDGRTWVEQPEFPLSR